MARKLIFTVVVLSLGFASRLTAADPFVFKDGDRVVLIGSTLIEREQKYGFWEHALTLKNKDKNVTFRNLGWSGDTVFGEARNIFDQSPKGYERLIELTKNLKPTVIVICYGHNESFEGKAGVVKFTAGLEKLLDAVAMTKARIVLVSPTPFEKADVLPNPEPNNKNLALYCDVLKATAEKRKLEYVDFFEQVLSWSQGRPTPGPTKLTDNGLHLTPEGYQFTASMLTSYRMPDLGSRDEKLRSMIIDKNELFFHRWRPQNVTYLFLFRKGEQGNNAKDIPAFDLLIDLAEKEIVELKK